MPTLSFIIARIGTPEIVIIAVLILLLFGAKKIPEFMRSIGKGIREFKDSMNTDNDKDEKPKQD